MAVVGGFHGLRSLLRPPQPRDRAQEGAAHAEARRRAPLQELAKLSMAHLPQQPLDAGVSEDALGALLIRWRVANQPHVVDDVEELGEPCPEAQREEDRATVEVAQDLKHHDLGGRHFDTERRVAGRGSRARRLFELPHSLEHATIALEDRLMAEELHILVRRSLRISAANEDDVAGLVRSCQQEHSVSSEQCARARATATARHGKYVRGSWRRPPLNR
mmetsp:Transcript_34641/g.75635  ORF Transcript_34641/g.75635 Transcript_34641/m.75635 type:complete len:219 (+) Transcript_34641:311-967(+)